MFKILLSLTLLAALAAFVTKPGPDRVELLLRDKVQSAIAAQDNGQTTNPAAKTALALCKLDANACFKLIRAGVELTYTDRWLFARVDLSGFGKTTTCYAVFTRLWCSGDILSA